MGSEYRNTEVAPPDVRAKIINPKTHGLPDRPTADLEIIARALPTAAANRLNILSPVTYVDWLPPDHILSFRIIQFSMERPWHAIGGKHSNGTWYETDGGLALHKAALRQAASIGEASWSVSRLDQGRISAYWAIKASVVVRGMSGMPRVIECSKELDLRDGSPLVVSYQENARAKNQDATRRILNARADGQRTCETKAVNAAIRDAFSIQGAYSEEQALRPFVIPVLIYAPQSPEALHRAIREATTASSMIFGATTRQAPAVPAKADAPAAPAQEQPTWATQPAQASQPAQRALPDHGGNLIPNYQDEIARLERREPVAAQPAARTAPVQFREMEEPDREDTEEPFEDEPPAPSSPAPGQRRDARGAPNNAPASSSRPAQPRRQEMPALPPREAPQAGGAQPDRRAQGRPDQQRLPQRPAAEQWEQQQRFRQQPPAHTSAPPTCKCGKVVSGEVAEFSRRAYNGQIFCMSCQPSGQKPAQPPRR